MNAAAARSRPMLGIALVLLMGVCFSVLDSSAKYLGQTLPVLLVLTARYLVQAIGMGAWLAVRRLRGGTNLFRTGHPRFHLVRGLMLLACSALLIVGIPHMPVAEFTAIGMLSPVILTVLAVTFLREQVSLLRALLVAGGFVGALIVVRPGTGLFGWPALIPLAMAFIYACFQLLTRRLAGVEHPLTTHFYTGLVGTAIVLGSYAFADTSALRAAWQAAPPSSLAMLGVVGAMGTAGHLLLILAIGVAPIPVLMPFTYLQLVFASVAGYLVFRHVPDGWAFTGMAVVGLCGAASVWLNFRESAAARRIPPEESALTAD